MIFVSSSAGKLRVLSPELQKEFSRNDLDINGLIALMKKFEKDVESNRWKEEGWPTQCKLSIIVKELKFKLSRDSINFLFFF